MRVLTITNQKGGVAKTTTALALCSALQKKGYKVLLVDTDAQCDSSRTCGAQLDNVATFYDIVVPDKNNPCSIQEAIQHTDFCDIIAGDRLLADSELAIKNDQIGGVYRLKKALSDPSLDYDFVILDTNFSLSSILMNCLIASDDVIVPVDVGEFALTGITRLVDAIDYVREGANSKLKVAGILLVRYKKTRFAKAVSGAADDLANMMHTKVFATPIRECVKVGESQSEKVSLLDYARDCTSAQDYIAVTNEYLERIKE